MTWPITSLPTTPESGDALKTVFCLKSPADGFMINWFGRRTCASSPKNNLLNSFTASVVPLAAYKSLILFIRFLFDVPDARLLGIPAINDNLSFSRKSKIVVSVFPYSRSCCMFCTGFARYSSTVAVEPDVPPVIVSPVMNNCWEVM